MKSTDLGSPAGKIRDALKKLRRQWEETKEVWDDVTRREFEENHLVPLERKCLQALEAISRLAPTLDHIHRACDDR